MRCRGCQRARELDVLMRLNEHNFPVVCIILLYFSRLRFLSQPFFSVLDCSVIAMFFLPPTATGGGLKQLSAVGVNAHCHQVLLILRIKYMYRMRKIDTEPFPDIPRSESTVWKGEGKAAAFRSCLASELRAFLPSPIGTLRCFWAAMYRVEA